MIRWLAERLVMGLWLGVITGVVMMLWMYFRPYFQ